MQIQKRDGTFEDIKFDKIVSRISRLCNDLRAVDVPLVAQKVINGMYPGVKTSTLDDLTAETAAFMSTHEYEYSLLAARISVSNLHKETVSSFSKVTQNLYENHVDGRHAPLVSKEYADIVSAWSEMLDNAINYENDYQYNYFGIKTLMKSYLFKTSERDADGTNVAKVAERPQHMLMRVAVALNIDPKNSARLYVEEAIAAYRTMSSLYFTHATPTLFNAGTPIPQMSSCFLLHMHDDSIDGIFKTVHNCSLISKCAGGIGLSVSNIRSTGSYIRGSSGKSNGIVPMLRVFDATARYVDQGGGKRPGAFAMYLEPWHADIFAFLNMKKNVGKDEERARDLFYGLWIPDLFMRRVEANADWSLFCPHDAPGLMETWGHEFEREYEQYEASGRARRVVKAQDVWFAILDAQIETGTPYMLYKDAANRKSNQRNLGTITCSNLCTEIIEYTSADECAVCNLASIALNKFVENMRFNFEHLHEVTRQVTINLNKVIDLNAYPIPEAKTSNLKHRPIGIGVQGLADTFMLMRLPFDSAEARQLNKDIFETIYHSALCTSMQLAQEAGPYASYDGSPMSKGVLQCDMWGVTPSDRWDWATLRADIGKHGVRNSLLVAPMPTASTAQIMGNTECFEPYTSNMYSRRVLAGDFTVINEHLMRDLKKINLWTPEMRDKIIANNGSVQGINEIPVIVKQLYKTAWELKQKVLVDMAIDRGAYICQSQSFNVFVSSPSHRTLNSLHFYGWKNGLKTGMYYLRTQGAASAIKFTIDPSNNEPPVCRKDSTCEACSA